MVKLIAGLMGSSVATGSSKMASTDQIRPFLAMLRNHDITELDTARVYNSGKSEEDLGAIPEAQANFKIATKAPGFSPGSLSAEKVIANCKASLAALQQDQIELYYFHGPDRQTPLEESCKAINQLYQEGKIAEFGISNFNKDEVEEIHSTCSMNGWLAPTVHQGGFNPLSRAAEEKLFPTLRKLNMAFYAFSPLAGGYFSRSTDQLREPPAGGRYDQMKHFKNMYVNDLSLELHDMLSEACAREDVTVKAAALRYLAHHSALRDEDGIILGASSQEQMEENLAACEAEKLPGSIVSAFELLWTRYKGHGYSDMYCV
ncbi:Oxidoreductase sirO [Fulvia fulva]|uniref:Oxidoreductase sirO n=1 Tax=Passalora fulva TaxID=5499 RepID=A0A9Q8L6G4_PASFU|nr:Oxidoreductase sirO [Fulvia fulva]KAK4635730.1 Oxidoreductase sirO [Fulvia fulva]KAK4637523.1 Oxidoreductase sirO [Fulvia fulva]UJO11740.1 Oxidoreductase sirO [Fulvia fulva]WPV08575.1 Oxidoreductase sirO [Fulvia fulva]WPV25093.1 Oxidoreductase sirO [Fulvia fulva]